MTRGDGVTKQMDRVLIPDALARAAAAYQHYRLALGDLRRQRVAAFRVGGGPVTNHRGGAAALALIHEFRGARDELRDEIRHLVQYLQGTGAPLRRIIDHVQGVLDALRAAGVLQDDGGAMSYELAHWIIEDISQQGTDDESPKSRYVAPRTTGRGRVIPLPRATGGRTI